eukprot:TRINITY_DN52149_c0_g1_i1.p1 TRINITY_DN52149_c0_g1~~TRINITY_DN52149_c0_g1_i1.p1  ORF type:complete len:110 (+),score=5.07 TRINITY_DN52149_c0_g1_i1:24-353(+)
MLFRASSMVRFLHKSPPIPTAAEKELFKQAAKRFNRKTSFFYESYNPYTAPPGISKPNPATVSDVDKFFPQIIYWKYLSYVFAGATGLWMGRRASTEWPLTSGLIEKFF